MKHVGSTVWVVVLVLMLVLLFAPAVRAQEPNGWDNGQWWASEPGAGAWSRGYGVDYGAGNLGWWGAPVIMNQWGATGAGPGLLGGPVQAGVPWGPNWSGGWLSQPDQWDGSGGW